MRTCATRSTRPSRRSSEPRGRPAAMSFLCVLAALSLEQLHPLAHPSVLELLFTRYAGRLARDLNAGQAIHGTMAWFVAVLPWVVLALIAHYLFSALGLLFPWAWAVPVLFPSIAFNPI